jgi:hypothetical protein
MPRRCPQQRVLDRRGEGPERKDLRVLPVRWRVHWQRLHQQRQPVRALWLLIPGLPDGLSGQQELHPGAHQLGVRPGARPCQRCKTVLVLLSLQCLEERLCCWVLTQTDCCPPCAARSTRAAPATICSSRTAPSTHPQPARTSGWRLHAGRVAASALDCCRCPACMTLPVLRHQRRALWPLLRYGWIPYDCTDARHYMCEVPFDNITCPSSPPPAEPPLPPATLCEQRGRPSQLAAMRAAHPVWQGLEDVGWPFRPNHSRFPRAFFRPACRQRPHALRGLAARGHQLLLPQQHGRKLSAGAAHLQEDGCQPGFLEQRR